MFINKLVTIVACVALALNSAAASEGKIHISVHSNAKSNGCGGGNLVIIGDLGSFCTHAGTPCGGSTEGVCPPAQPALENGSTCTKLGSGEYGCMANSPPAAASNSTSTASSEESASESSSTSESDDSTSESGSESTSESEADSTSESESDSTSGSEESTSDDE